ncbi:MAG: pyridoxal phosphate-dependent aminotransferase [Zavarzinella sp.]
MIRISQLANSVQPSATLAAGAKAKKMKAEGIRIYDFSLGEPDFATPPHICAAAQAAMDAGHTHYTPVNGIPEVKKAICQWYQTKYGYQFTPEQVMVSNGAKHSLHNVLAATLNPGDEVIIPAPYWVSYSDLVQMTGAVPVIVQALPENGFKMLPSQLQAALTPKTRLLMLNSPSNPTGAVYSRAELQALADVIMTTDVAILSDEIYEQLIYGDHQATCVATLSPEVAARTITVSGASKSYAMTGWRMGWAIAPKPLIDAMGNIQSQETSCPSSISQYALVAALTGPQECVGEMHQAFDERRKYVCERLRKVPGIRFSDPEGAFYLFFDVSQHFGKTIGGQQVTDSASFCKSCLETGHVNLVPGSAFGTENFVRMSYANSMQELEEGLNAFEKWLQS